MSFTIKIALISCFVIVAVSGQRQNSGSLEDKVDSSVEPRADSSNGYPRRAQPSRDANAVDDEYQPMEPYAFGYNVKDDLGNNQYRKEEAGNDGVIKGSYGYTDAAGLYRVVEYIADRLGFRTKIRSNEPGLKSMTSSYVVLDAQSPPEAVVAAASAPKASVAEKPALVAATLPTSSGLNPRFRYITSASELRPQVALSSDEPAQRS